MTTTTMSGPRHETTINQHRGDRPEGPIYQLVKVVTSYTDYCQGRAWEDLPADDRGWWADTLAKLHAARVELESIPDAGLRDRVREILTHEECDLEDEPGVIHRAIDAALDEGIEDACGELLEALPRQDAATQAALIEGIDGAWSEYLEAIKVR